MLFSIVVPVFNSSKTIRNCLDSILLQSYKNYEVVIVNDGSTDDSKEICSEYTSKYSNFHLHNFSNLGVTINRIRGKLLSKGDYIIFVDSDDTINQDLLLTLNKVLHKHPDLDLIRYQANLLNDESYKNHERYNYTDKCDCIYSGLDALRMWSAPGIKYAVYWLYAYKRSLFPKLFFVPAFRCYEDVACIPLLIASAKKVMTINYCGYNYTCNRNESLTNSKSIIDQLGRAHCFYQACNFAKSKFKLLKNVSDEDVEFFNRDYDRRLNEFACHLSPIFKDYLSSNFGIKF